MQGRIAPTLQSCFHVRMTKGRAKEQCHFLCLYSECSKRIIAHFYGNVEGHVYLLIKQTSFQTTSSMTMINLLNLLSRCASSGWPTSQCNPTRTPHGIWYSMLKQALGTAESMFGAVPRCLLACLVTGCSDY